MSNSALTIWPDLGYGVEIGHIDQEGWPFEMKRCEPAGVGMLWEVPGHIYQGRQVALQDAPDFADGILVAHGWIYKRRLLEIRVEDASFEGAEDIALFGSALLRLSELAENLRREAA